jgi:hypothetical protein
MRAAAYLLQGRQGADAPAFRRRRGTRRERRDVRCGSPDMHGNCSSDTYVAHGARSGRGRSEQRRTRARVLLRLGAPQPARCASGAARKRLAPKRCSAAQRGPHDRLSREECRSARYDDRGSSHLAESMCRATCSFTAPGPPIRPQDAAGTAVGWRRGALTRGRWLRVRVVRKHVRGVALCCNHAAHVPASGAGPGAAGAVQHAHPRTRTRSAACAMATRAAAMARC